MERGRALEQGCSMWHLGGKGRAKKQSREIHRGERDLAFSGLAGWTPLVKYISTDKQV